MRKVNRGTKSSFHISFEIFRLLILGKREWIENDRERRVREGAELPGNRKEQSNRSSTARGLPPFPNHFVPVLMRLGNISPRRSNVGSCEWDDDADGDDARRTSYEGKRTSREKSVWPRAPTITVHRRSHVALFAPAGRSQFQIILRLVSNKLSLSPRVVLPFSFLHRDLGAIYVVIHSYFSLLVNKWKNSGIRDVVLDSFFICFVKFRRWSFAIERCIISWFTVDNLEKSLLQDISFL